MTLYKFNHPPTIQKLIEKKAFEIYQWRQKYDKEGSDIEDYLEAERKVLSGEWRDG